MTDYDFIDADLPEKNGDEEPKEYPKMEVPAEVMLERDVEETTDAEGIEDYPELQNRSLTITSDTDKVGVEQPSEDNRGFLGRAYNQIKNLI